MKYSLWTGVADEYKPTKKSEEEWPEIKEPGGQNASETKVGKNRKIKWALAESETTSRSSISRAEKQWLDLVTEVFGD